MSDSDSPPQLRNRLNPIVVVLVLLGLWCVFLPNLLVRYRYSESGVDKIIEALIWATLIAICYASGAFCHCLASAKLHCRAIKRFVWVIMLMLLCVSSYLSWA